LGRTLLRCDSPIKGTRLRVIVTGATGFVGRHLVAALVRRGHQVVAVGRDPAKAKAMPWLDQVEFLAHDIHSQAVDRMLKRGVPDAVAHLAWADIPHYRATVHVERTLPADAKLLRQLIEAGVPQLLVSGTCLEYGMAHGPLHENLPANPNTPYAIAKNALRQFLEPISQSHGCRLQWPRLFYTFGEGQSRSSLLAQLDRTIESGAANFKMSRGEQLRDYLPIAEVAEKLSDVLDSKFSGIINICSGHPISVRRLVEEHLARRGVKMDLFLGHYPYVDYEPIAFWGDPARFESSISPRHKGVA
jgi:nucleoside-diphosphate-sugar epimerase